MKTKVLLVMVISLLYSNLSFGALFNLFESENSASTATALSTTFPTLFPTVLIGSQSADLNGVDLKEVTQKELNSTKTPVIILIAKELGSTPKSVKNAIKLLIESNESVTLENIEMFL